jgi:hypothetical protein
MKAFVPVGSAELYRVKYRKQNDVREDEIQNGPDGGEDGLNDSVVHVFEARPGSAENQSEGLPRQGENGGDVVIP